MTEPAERFTIAIPQEALDDLRTRLIRTRWSNDVGNEDWTYGTPRTYLEPFVEYWLNEYDWRVHEAAMNRFEHYRTVLDGIPIHFLHRRGTGPRPIPLLMTHGWPETFWDFSEMIDPLADPAGHGGSAADAFDVVVPSLPGFGFSSPLSKAGVGAAVTVGLWRRLMREVLGYDRFGVVGEDFGAIISQRLGEDHSDDLIGVHLNRYQRAPNMMGGKAGEELQLSDYGPDEIDDYKHTLTTMQLRVSHFTVHTSDPQSLAYGLDDSPVALAAWLLERRRNWSDCDGDIEKVFSRDQLITTIMLYWLTRTGGSSIRFYWETAHEASRAPSPGKAITAPTAIATLPADLLALPRKHAEEDTDLRSWKRLPRGGHFGASEVPDLLVDDLREFFRPLR
jgi:pimeloyl-ACP methyl ester carboxylesterase